METESNRTRLQILSCGQSLVARKGFVGMGLSELLSLAGVPKGSFYHYFPSKEAFGVALLGNYFELRLAALEALFAVPGLNGAQRLEAWLQRWIENQCSDDPARLCLIVKLSAEIADLSETMRAAMQTGTAAIIRRLADGIEAGQRDGSIVCPTPPVECARWLFGAWLGAGLLAKVQRDAGAYEIAVRQTQDFLGSR